MMIISGLLLLCINTVICEDCELDNASRDLNHERQLYRDLMCNYDVFRSPQNTTTVDLRFLLRNFYFDTNEELFTINSWISYWWEDERLKWDPESYDGLSDIILDSDLIWTPVMMHHSNMVYDNLDDILTDMCRVVSSGEVMCLSQSIAQSECSAALANWPYDIQSCSFRFGAHNKYKDNTVFTFNSTGGITTFGAEYGAGWNIIDYEKGENATSDTQIYLTFVVERQGTDLECIVVAPSLALSVLTVSSLFLDAGGARGAVALLSLSSHFYIQTFLNASIPKQSSTAPSILRYVSASLALTSIAIVLSFVLSSLRTRRVPPPTWVVAVNRFAFKTPAKFLIVPRWGARGSEPAADQTNTDVEAWTDFANVINGASIIIAILVYVTLSLSFMPRQMPIDYTPL